MNSGATNTTGSSDQLLIYGASGSAFTRKVLLVLEYKRIPYKTEMGPPTLFQQLNPLGKMPVLRVEGTNIIDSSVICDFLERRYPAIPIYPADDLLRARSLWLEEYVDSALQAAMYPFVNEALFKPGMYGQPGDAQVIKDSQVLIGTRLDYLEGELTGDYLVEGMLSIADITLLAVLGNPLRAGLVIDAARWPRLSVYVPRLLAMEPFAGRWARQDLEMAQLQRNLIDQHAAKKA
jgi:glutathione S-transferase